MSDKLDRHDQAFLKHKSISRRGLFRVFGSLPKQVVKASQCEQQLRKVARPPGALDEPLYLETCDGCQKCVQACPEQVIEIVDKLAQLNLDYGYCSQCGDCQEVCPTQALSSHNKDNQLRPQISESCQNKLFGDCRLCANACPKGIITIGAKQTPLIDESLCDGCGRCQQACAFSAIHLKLSC